MHEGSSHSRSHEVSDATSSSQSARSGSPVSSLQSTTGDRPGQRTMPRTSSIDSAISALSFASHSQKSSFDPNALSQDDINNLISTAGSAEALIVHLLKEKHHIASQNAQLWRLVDKQRALVLGLNRDLERALKDKERYRKKVKELQSQAPPVPVTASQATHNSPPAGTNPSESDESGTRRPSQDVASHPGGPGPLPHSQGEVTKSYVDNPTEDAGMLPAPLQTPHAHSESSSRSSPEAPSLPSGDRSAASNVNCTGSGVSSHTDENNPHQEPSAAHPTEASLNGRGSTTSDQEWAAVPHLSGPVERQHSAVCEELGVQDLQAKMSPPNRKPPPAPLNLRQAERASEPLHQAGPDNSESDYDDVSEVDEIPAVERGRRRTREEDDREREAAMMREKEARSRSSKKKTRSMKATEHSEKPQAAATALPSSPRQMVPQSPPFTEIGHASEPESLASVLSPQNSQATSLGERLGVSPPMSPGLPVSPRPGDRPIGSPLPRMPREGSGPVSSPPSSPRSGMPGLPLSPRAPKYPISPAPNSPVSAASQPVAKANGFVSSPIHGEAASRPIPAIDAAVKIDSPGSPPDVPRGIYQGLVSDDYPGLLLPPNALPSVEVKVSSSRLRPSRNSYMAPKPSSDDDPVFTLSVFSRSDKSELWRVEKAIPALLQLDQQIRQVLDFPGKLPDRSIFSGHSPAKVDARRAALNAYFETLLDTPMDETAALIICRFLTSDAIEPRDDETSLVKGNSKTSPEVLRGPDGKPRKEGYLTKRGKNFGGWKARYFVLHGPELKYFESPGGPHLGTIKLQNAQIGKQSQSPGGQNQSPSRNDDDSDNQYRHAFLILEPKKKDSSAFVRHVLCAESDEERDAWVDALLQYVERDSSGDETSNVTSSKGQNQTQGRHAPSTTTKSRLFSGGSKRSGKGTDSPEQDPSDTVQGFSYDNAVPAEPPIHGPSYEKDAAKPSPTRSGSVTENLDTNQNHQPGWEQGQSTSHTSKVISGPTNGTVIQDAGAWGNKPATSTREKKRSIFGFRTRSSSDLASHILSGNESSANSGHHSSSIERKGFVIPVFGMPLAEALQLCPPQGVGVDVELPAVVYRCIEYLKAKGAASEEGIFRLSGSNVVVKALKERFNTEGDIDLLAGDQYYDVHAVASLFKQYLRELPTTVLTRELHLDFLRVLELDDRQKRITALNALVHKLPKPNFALLRALSQFLIVIVNNSDVNKMTVRNVGIVFAPTLNIPAPVFSLFLTDFDSIFGEAPDSTSQDRGTDC